MEITSNLRAANKYGAVRVENKHGNFASGLEAAVHEYLWLREKAGEIKDLECQIQVRLTLAKIVCIPDFRYVNVATGETVYAEAKGFAGPRWPTIKRLWKYYGPGPLEIYMGSKNRFQIDETIIPELNQGG